MTLNLFTALCCLISCAAALYCVDVGNRPGYWINLGVAVMNYVLFL